MSPVAFLMLTLFVYLTYKQRLALYLSFATTSGLKTGGAQSANTADKSGIAPNPGDDIPSIDVSPQTLMRNWSDKLSPAMRAAVENPLSSLDQWRGMLENPASSKSTAVVQ